GDSHPMVVPAEPARGGDPCGAGDRFASAAAGALADGGLPSEAVIAAVEAASDFVAAGGASSVRVGRPSVRVGRPSVRVGRPSVRVGQSSVRVGQSSDAPDTSGPFEAPDAAWSAAAPGVTWPAEAPGATGPPDARQVVARTRARDGTVVATGGCFDLLHAGHVAMLRAARALGDCLIVCLNSDASVRRLKGPDRPLVPEEDRAAVLLGLGCVDAVAVFDEDTPAAILDDLRPDVWAKGADYAAADLPETSVLERWGGQAVVLPYLEGRSTSRLLQEVLRRGR
ncbi:MAG TPA: D-glycero-beta-D-manno-heptose 1-phosphate adenylyltransferase, partial [Nitriliruptorales bacterium]|nr:D-glycero-beta-D-manno-heptose 1-phosphate adenylyltransferase [Nitriliruptorales bacterium]